jgi:hypothetical protein
MTPVVESILLRSLVLFLMAGSLAGLVVGVLLLWHPERLRAINNILNRWISTRRIDKPLERSIVLDPWFYRYRRTSSTLVLLASAYLLYFFTAGIDRTNTILVLSRHFSLPPGFVGVLLDALVLSALLGAALAAFVSLFLLWRPSALREFEQSANQWVSLRRALKPLEVQRLDLDEYVSKYGRQTGILLVLGSLYTLVFLTVWLSHNH